MLETQLQARCECGRNETAECHLKGALHRGTVWRSHVHNAQAGESDRVDVR